MSHHNYTYDAFISYRHVDPDESFANDICRRLEALGLRISIDYKDFAPNKTFLEESERCIKDSQFTLVVVSNNYFSSGNCVEEAIICKVLDMEERSRRLVPLKIENCEMPVWLYALSGINFLIENPNPYDKLIDLFYSHSRQVLIGGSSGLEKNVAGDRLVSKVKARELLTLAIGGVTLGAVIMNLPSSTKSANAAGELTDDLVEDSIIEGAKKVIGKIIDWV